MPRWSAERRAAVAHAAAAPPRRARNRACRARHGGSRLSALHPLGFCRAVRPLTTRTTPCRENEGACPDGSTSGQHARRRATHTAAGRRPRLRARGGAARLQHAVRVPPLLSEQALPAQPPLLGRDPSICHAIFWPVVPEEAKAWWRAILESQAHRPHTPPGAERSPKPPGRMRGSAPSHGKACEIRLCCIAQMTHSAHSKAPRDRGALRQRVPVRSNNTGT